jgi:hypothetical protein
MKLHRPELFTKGYHLASVPLPDELSTWVKDENWSAVDQYFKLALATDGEMNELLAEFHQFSSVEFIISVRDANNEWEEDGIWHDDGSRVFAFSLSLTTDPVEGGRLGIRKIGDQEGALLPTPAFGTIILFLTGQYGYEHKIHQVTQGRRVIIAGWCS